jgi:phosphocarrier protein
LLRTVRVVNARGLHARAAAKFVKCVGQFNAEVKVTKDGQTVPGNSIMGLMMLAASKGTTIDIETAGQEADGALDALVALVSDGFGEEQ